MPNPGFFGVPGWGQMPWGGMGGDGFDNAPWGDEAARTNEPRRRRLKPRIPQTDDGRVYMGYLLRR